jgi:hypothetical protein
LFKLAEALCVEPGSLLQRQAEARPPEKDDVTVEAMLAMVGKAVNRDDIAWALEWEIERVNHALLALEARLLGTGQRLRRAKFGWFGLAPTEDTLAPEEAQNIGRATCTEYGINLSQARTLYKVAHGERLHQNHTRGRSDRLYNPISILLRAGLLGQEESGIALSAEVAYSLCFEDVRTAQPRPLKPQTRRLRAGYCVDHREKKEAGA